MNPEQNAKAYEMALEAARKELGVDRKEWEVVQQVLCNIFPELAKSDNERIRKALYKVVSDIAGGWPFERHDITKKDALAYLEKQKEANKAIEAVDRIDKYIDEHLANAHDMKDSDPEKKYYRGWDDALGKMAGILQDVYSNEKQKEQKPVSINPDDKHMLERIMELVEFCNDKEIIWNWLCEKVKEQKPAENHTLEFEKAKAKYEGIVEGKQTVLDNPEDYGLYKPAEWDEEDIKKIRSEEYTKGFNDAAFGGKLKEWSVEDEDRIRQIERIAQEAGCTQKLQEEIHDWLKSLRSCPKSSDNWKPSEEQMEVLLSTQDMVRSSGYRQNAKVLASLYEQLKRLM